MSVPSEIFPGSSSPQVYYDPVPPTRHSQMPPHRRPRRRNDFDPNHIPEKQLEEAVEAGSRCEVKCLYEGPPKCTCCTNWMEEPPEDSSDNDAQKTRDMYGDFAVVQRKTPHGIHARRSWETSTITVQSALIRDALAKVFEGYPGISMAPQQVEFRAPFQPFLHRWAEFIKCEEEVADKEIEGHLKLLRDVIEPELQPFFKAQNDCVNHNIISFDALWAIFPPGALVYWKADGTENIMRVTGSAPTWTLGRSWHVLHGEQVDWNGNYFGLADVSRWVSGYDGTRSIFELEAMPLSMHPDRDAIKQRLIDRGRKFEELRGYHFKAYDGSCQNTIMYGGNARSGVHERIVIDALAFSRCQRLATPALRRFKLENVPTDNTIIPAMPPQEMMAPCPSYSLPLGPMQSYPDVSMSPIQQDWSLVNPASKTRTQKFVPEEVAPLTDDQLMLCVAEVRGFDLKTKEWRRFNVLGITDIDWDEDAFDSLVLPNEEKDLLLAFAQSKINAETNFEDLIQGKGKGIIMLLSGPPGVGKTLTAESIAESTRVPLYTMSAGEIGIVPTNVENHLKSALDRCTMWNAIFLLDEADIFLEKRDLNNLKRNELVSIFLRLVEYYEGIMFLTTNRIQAIDPAFESRIDVAVAYPALTTQLRKQIWFNFLARLPGGTCELDDADMENLAEADLNGRQIRSAVKTAQMLAGRKGENVCIDHVKRVLKLREHAKFG